MRKITHAPLPRARRRARAHNAIVDLIKPNARHLGIESKHIHFEAHPSGKIRAHLTRAGREALGLE